jgi:GMP synthase (glutamine-hydrolysing)
MTFSIHDLKPTASPASSSAAGPAVIVSDARQEVSGREQDRTSRVFTDAGNHPRDVPFLGCCYGIGVLAHHLGAPVTKDRYAEPVGPTQCSLTSDAASDPLLDGVPQSFTAFVGHKEAVQSLPAGCVHLVSSEPCPFQMIRHGENVYATQFHPELDSNGLEVRINIYKNRGYFAPEEADALIAQGHATPVHMPEVILKRFVDRYRKVY